ncbi:MAG: metallophosphoesterase [Rhodospirillales bacterium]
MRLLIYSDLHNEFEEFVPPVTEKYDVVVLAGDIDLGVRGIEWAADNFERKPIIFVPGNHEFYCQDGRSIQSAAAEMRAAAEWHGINLLDPGAVEIMGWRFIGATLWSDFDLHGELKRAHSMNHAIKLLNDYRLIHKDQSDGTRRKITPSDTRSWFLKEREFLFREIEKGDPTRTIIVTHFVPTTNAIEPRYKGDLLSPAFVSDLDYEIEQSGVAAWIFGHSHSCCDFLLGETCMLSNQRGYPHEPVQGFDPGLVIEL